MAVFHDWASQWWKTYLIGPLNEDLCHNLSNEISCTLNGDHMQMLRPQKVDVLTYPNRANMTFDTSSPRVRFLDV
jgi:hypothetical protein